MNSDEVIPSGKNATFLNVSVKYAGSSPVYVSSMSQVLLTPALKGFGFEVEVE